MLYGECLKGSWVFGRGSVWVVNKGLWGLLMGGRREAFKVVGVVFGKEAGSKDTRLSVS